MNGTAATWVASTVAFTETRRPTDLIVVSLPRKYDVSQPLPHLPFR